MENLPFLASLPKSYSSFTKVDSYGLSSPNHKLPFRSFCRRFGNRTQSFTNVHLDSKTYYGNMIEVFHTESSPVIFVLPFTSLHFTSRHVTSLHFTSLHFTSRHLTSLLATIRAYFNELPGLKLHCLQCFFPNFAYFRD